MSESDDVSFKCFGKRTTLNPSDYHAHGFRNAPAKVK